MAYLRLSRDERGTKRYFPRAGQRGRGVASVRPGTLAVDTTGDIDFDTA